MADFNGKMESNIISSENHQIDTPKEKKGKKKIKKLKKKMSNLKAKLQDEKRHSKDVKRYYKEPESVKLVVKSHAHFALFCSEISLTTAE